MRGHDRHRTCPNLFFLSLSDFQAVFTVDKKNGLTLTEIAADTTVEEVQTPFPCFQHVSRLSDSWQIKEKTGAPFKVAPNLKTISV